MSLDATQLEVLIRSGTPKEKKNARKILPIIKKPHHLLVTLLLTNALAMTVSKHAEEHRKLIGSVILVTCSSLLQVHTMIWRMLCDETLSAFRGV
jgi:metal transporter CNNM